MKKNNFIYIVLVSLGFIACEPEFDQEIGPVAPQEKGQADFSKYVSLGNSLTAGFADGALYSSGQEVAFSNLLAEQMKAAGGGSFNTPLMPDDLGGFSGSEENFGTRFVLQITSDGNQVPVRANNNVASNNITAKLSGQFQNMGVPGIKSYQFGFEGLGNPAGLTTDPISANPYFVRFAQSPESSILGDALVQQPTFFTLWLGNNDVLSYATSGGIGVDQKDNPDPRTYGPNDITSPVAFADAYQRSINALTAGGAKGVVVNIPNVTSIPFFTTVPYNPIPMDEATATATNVAYARYNGGLQLAVANGLMSSEEANRRMINFEVGQNAVVILDENLTDYSESPLPIPDDLRRLPQLRQTTSADLIVLPASSFIGTRQDENNPATTNGVGIPLADQWVLTSTEVEALNTATSAYNTAISGIAEANENIVLYNANRRLVQLERGIPIEGGAPITSTFGTGGAFSLDGVHLTPKGNAVIANDLIKVINASFNSTLQEVDPNLFGTITLQ